MLFSNFGSKQVISKDLLDLPPVSRALASKQLAEAMTVTLVFFKSCTECMQNGSLHAEWQPQTLHCVSWQSIPFGTASAGRASRLLEQRRLIQGLL